MSLPMVLPGSSENNVTHHQEEPMPSSPRGGLDRTAAAVLAPVRPSSTSLLTMGTDAQPPPSARWRTRQDHCSLPAVPPPALNR